MRVLGSRSRERLGGRRGARWALVALLVVMTGGCIKRAEPRKAAEPTPVAAVFLIDQESETEVLAGPPALVDQASAALAERNLVVRSVDEAAWREAFATSRSTRQRMVSLLDDVDEDVILLVETRARLASLMEGRYTWTVPVQITMVRRGRSDFPNQASIEVPTFLRFAHQDADDAVAAAAPVIVRRLERMVEELLGDEGQLGVRAAPESSEDPATVAPPRGERDAIYFAMVDRHRNGDPSNDRGADPRDPQAFHGGDLRGLIQDVDRIAALGFKSLWVTPVWDTRDERIGPWGAFHGYWVEDPGAVEPRFGTEAELIELRDALAGRGMGLILDFVANHVAPGSPLVAEHPDWFHHLGDIEDWENAEEAITHDVHGLPDLAQEHPPVADWLIGHARDWQERLRPEGFRLDAVRHVAPAFWTELSGALRARDASVALVGELFDGDPRDVAESWRAGGFTGMFDFPLYYALTDVFCDDAKPGRLLAMLAQDGAYPDPSALVTFVDNHDLPRIASRCGDGGLAALRLILALRGRPAVTWGTELPLSGDEEPDNRGDFDWDAERRWEKHLALGLALRARWSGLRAAEREILMLDDGLAAWVQGDAASAAVVAVNRGPEARTVPLPALGDWQDPAMRRGIDELVVPSGSVAFAVTEGEGSALRDWLARAKPESVVVTVRLEGASIAKGDTILLIGASQPLGAWDPEAAVPARREGRSFLATVDVPRGQVMEFKFVTRQDGGHLVWEKRPNRYHLVQDGGELVARWEG